MITPQLIGFTAFLAVLLIYIGKTRPPDALYSMVTAAKVNTHLEDKLKRAGIVNVRPATIIFAGIMSCGIVFFVGLFASGNPLVGVMFAVAVPVFISMDLDRRGRRWHERLQDRMVPFFRRVESQVRIGQNPAKAFITAAKEDKLLSMVLQKQIADLELQRPFDEVLRESVEVIPLRAWVQFVRAMEAFQESGGELANILRNNVQRINSQIILRKRLMGDLAMYRSQQLVILAAAVAVPVILYFQAGDTFGSLISTPAGWIAIGIAVLFDVAAFKITSNAVEDVERRLEA